MKSDAEDSVGSARLSPTARTGLDLLVRLLLIASCIALYVSYDVVLGKFTYICGSFGNLDYPQIIALWSVVFLLMPMYLALRVRGRLRCCRVGRVRMSRPKVEG